MSTLHWLYMLQVLLPILFVYSGSLDSVTSSNGMDPETEVRFLECPALSNFVGSEPLQNLLFLRELRLPVFFLLPSAYLGLQFMCFC